MEWVMQMKKSLTVILILALLLAGLFFWKGGHHALFLADALEEWLDSDNADQYLTVQLSQPAFSLEEETIQPQVNQMSLSADTFWTEYGERRVFGLTAGECSAYLLDNILYMDTGKAYALPDFESDQLHDLLAGLLLYGRVTKSENLYKLTMETEELSLSVSVMLDRGISSITLNAEGTLDGAPVRLHATLTPKQATAHPIPTAVTDAMVRAKKEPPMPITEPLGVLLPALSDLMPFTADVTMGVACGILNLSETVELQVDNGQAILTRDGVQIDLTLPDEFMEVSPAAAGLLLLRSGEFTRNGKDASFTVALPGETTAQLAEALIPQAANLGINFTESTAVLTIRERTLTGISLTAGGSVPFLITEIPVSFSAEFDIH